MLFRSVVAVGIECSLCGRGDSGGLGEGTLGCALSEAILFLCDVCRGCFC